MIEDVDDVYSYYVFFIGLDSDVVLNTPISELKSIAINKIAI